MVKHPRRRMCNPTQYHLTILYNKGIINLKNNQIFISYSR